MNTTHDKSRTAAHFLVIGQPYDIDLVQLGLIGWTYGDGSGHDGYHVRDYFTADGRYRGADQHGIEPLIDDAYMVSE